MNFTAEDAVSNSALSSPLRLRPEGNSLPKDSVPNGTGRREDIF